MQDVIDFLFGAKGMMPLGYSFQWNRFLLWLFAISNAVIAASFFSISFALSILVYKRRDVDFKWMFTLFSAFFFTSGITHALSVITIWNPVYGLAAIAGASTAIVSSVTAILLWPLILKALHLPRPSSLLLANKKLEDEILDHKQTKAQLIFLNSELDRQVELRTRELQASESLLRKSLISSGIGSWEADLVKNKQTWSDNCFTLLGIPALQRPTWDDFLAVVHPEDRQQIIDLAHSHSESKTNYDVEYRLITTNGSMRWMRSAWQIEYDPAGKPSILRGIVQDVTGRKLSEQKNQQLANILEHSINEIYIINNKTLHFEHVNQGGINNLGYSLDELKNMTMRDIKPVFDSLFFNELIGQLLNGVKDRVIYETTFQRKNGTCYPVEICLQFFRNDPLYLVAICLDISERKAMERSLVDKHNLLLDMINNIPDYIFYKNTESEYLLCNKPVANYFNRPLEKIIGHNDFDLIDPATAQCFRQHDVSAMAQDKVCINEELITLPDGKEVLLETLKTPLKDNDGNVLGLIGIGRDITQRKMHEEKINILSNFYAILSKINHAIVQINNEKDLFSTVCAITANLQQVNMVWIGQPDALSGLFVPVAVEGKSKDYVTGLVVSADPDLPEGQGPTGIAYREKQIVTVNDFQADHSTSPWHDNTERHFDWGSSCAIPVLRNQEPYAVLNVYSNKKDFFDADVLKLMAELSIDLSFALDFYAHETARRHAEEKLELSAKVFSQSKEAIMITDKNNHIISVNRAFTTVTGYEEPEVLGENPKMLASGLHDKEFFRIIWETLLVDNFWQGELYNRRKDGTIYPEWLSISVARDENGNIVHHIAIFTDVTEHKAIEQQLEHLAHYDSLTNLPNRLLLKSRVDYELIVSERHKTSFALLFIDLDHFKNINDSLGHTIGDQVLVEVGRRLLACVRDSDTVARLGGDEFNILLPNCNGISAAIVANKIIDSLTESILYQSYRLHITPSIGISLYPDNGDSYENLSKNADTALYQAKKLGRNQFQFFTHSMQQQSLRRMEIEHDLRQAISRNELMVYFQPQINTQTWKIIGAEALLRWRHPVHGIIPPAEFIPVAEDCGLILPIGDWVLEQSIAQARQWHDVGFPLTIAVNLSLAQFRAKTLFEKVKQTLDCFRMPPQFLELELTESIAMQNAEMAIEITHQLTGLGIKLSIDDFGTGYSSLNYLQRFSLDKLKIDQLFTRNMTSNTESENIVDAIISLAKSLNLKTIAEGVETAQQLDMLKQKNCDEIQGYYFSKPIPAGEFITLMKKGFKPPAPG
ncbi:MAG: EAL domain-containing protein [Methylococcales bacterium]|nr:EAL domain-containing protein [Methylococcales bacterium]